MKVGYAVLYEFQFLIGKIQHVSTVSGDVSATFNVSIPHR